MSELPEWKQALIAQMPAWLVELLAAVKIPLDAVIAAPVQAHSVQPYRVRLVAAGDTYEAHWSPLRGLVKVHPIFGDWLILLRPCARCGQGEFRSAPLHDAGELGLALRTFAPVHLVCPDAPTRRLDD